MQKAVIFYGIVFLSILMTMTVSSRAQEKLWVYISSHGSMRNIIISGLIPTAERTGPRTVTCDIEDYIAEYKLFRAQAALAQ
jgi:hypothetical protein